MEYSPMRNTSIVLSDHWVEFARKQDETGRYGSMSEVVREGLKLIEARERHREAINAALYAGQTGDMAPNFGDFLEKVRGRGQLIALIRATIKE